jgi:hypothetical protein
VIDVDLASLTVAGAAALARELLSALEPRWSHVTAVGRRAEALCRDHGLPQDLAVAAWLHDVGYSPRVMTTGLHPLDGARFLQRGGAGEVVVSLVAHHTGAAVEARERGLSAELAQFAAPPADLLDALTWIDLTTDPQGQPVTVGDRLAEILRRYPPDHPVHRAVSRSSPALVEAAVRAEHRLRRPDPRP